MFKVLFSPSPNYRIISSKKAITFVDMSAPTSFDEATKIAADPNILKVSYSDKQKL